jgi:hypothetical protein
MLRRQQSERIDQIAMSFHRIQVADRDEQPVVGLKPELAAQHGPIGGGAPYPVRDDLDLAARHAQIPAQVVGELTGDGDEAAAARHRGAHRETAAKPGRVVAAAVHRDHVLDAGIPRGPAAVHGKGELVAVCHVDRVAPQDGSQGPGTRRRKWTIQPEMIDGDARALELPRQPPFSIRRKQHEVVRTRGLQARREIRQHAFGAPGTVRLDQVGDAEPAQPRPVHAPHRCLQA